MLMVVANNFTQYENNKWTHLTSRRTHQAGPLIIAFNKLCPLSSEWIGWRLITDNCPTINRKWTNEQRENRGHWSEAVFLVRLARRCMCHIFLGTCRCVCMRFFFLNTFAVLYFFFCFLMVALVCCRYVCNRMSGCWKARNYFCFVWTATLKPI